MDRLAHGYLTVVCDGMYSSLRTKLSQPDIKAPSYFVGLVLRDCSLPYDNYGHVVLARPSPILFYPISSSEVRCLVDYPGVFNRVGVFWVIVGCDAICTMGGRHHMCLYQRFTPTPKGTKLPSATNGELQAYLKNEVAPQIPAQLQQAFMAAVDTGRIRAMQNKCMPAKPLQQPGALLLGDAFNMRHPLTGLVCTIVCVCMATYRGLVAWLYMLLYPTTPLTTPPPTGGGMTVALSDTKLLADMLSPLPDLRDSLATAQQTTAFYTKRKPLSATINTLANALYSVFCYTGSPAHETMQQACFDYLALGGMYSSGPVSLLSGLNPRPSVLVMHFFMVALYGVGRLLLPRPTVGGLVRGMMLLWCAACIIAPIIAAEGIRAVFFPVIAGRPPAGAGLKQQRRTNRQPVVRLVDG